MKGPMGVVKRCLEKKDLRVNVAKTKIMVFQKRSGRWGKKKLRQGRTSWKV
ncbi:hypothetical protein RI129_013272 [Pyrocoelia pectoralis]|uniref:Ribosomal protein L36 n=1 Tax=Pyrocoelia pectoralis TaxID=417401 RepID=A0AAN7ZD53_9COLE